MTYDQYIEKMEVLYGFIVGLILGFILTISIKYFIVSIKKLKKHK